ncbi:unnamed protein product, partial [Brenthis ino]
MRCEPCAPLKICKSRELRGGLLYTDCFCLRRNGLQYDCRRSGCQNSSLCQTLPAPLCGPAAVACIKHCQNPHAEELRSICKMRKMCSPCGPMVCYKYEDCGPSLQCLPRSAFKRNGLQDCQFFQQGSIRYLCRAGPCCSKPCPPSCPPCKEKYAETAPGADDGGAEKKEAIENQIKRTKSRELRGGVMYYSCHCIKRNGLQHDCRRTGCGGEPACLVLPDPVCAPSQLARARGLADSAPFAAHVRAQAGGSGSYTGPDTSSGSGKRFIVCELKGVIPDTTTKRTGQCCKLPTSITSEITDTYSKLSNDLKVHQVKCSCTCNSYNKISPIYSFDDQTMENILSQFQNKDLKDSDRIALGPGGRPQKPVRTVFKEECTRPGCVHWKQPSPCLWSLPCKADCFETPLIARPVTNVINDDDGSSLPSVASANNQKERKMIVLTPKG